METTSERLKWLHERLLDSEEARKEFVRQPSTMCSRPGSSHPKGLHLIELACDAIRSNRAATETGGGERRRT